MEKSIIGRKEEITRLKKYIASDRSEFIAIYGRRRVGKTFLIKELLEGQFTFRMTGKENARMADQLLNFSYAMSDFFSEEKVPKDWTEAFRMLSKAIEKMKEGEGIVIGNDTVLENGKHTYQETMKLGEKQKILQKSKIETKQQ